MNSIVYSELLNDMVEFCREHNINADEIAQLLDKCKIDVAAKLLQTSSELHVIKKDGRTEKFDKEKLFVSIGSASDEIHEPLTTGDIHNIVNYIMHLIAERHTNILTSTIIKEETLKALQDLGFYDVYTNYKNYIKDSIR